LNPRGLSTTGLRFFKIPGVGFFGICPLPG